MIEISDIRIPLERLGATHEQELSALRRHVAHALGTRERAFSTFELRRRAIDARRGAVRLVYTVRVGLSAGAAAEQRALAHAARGRQRPKARLLTPEDLAHAPAWPARHAPGPTRPVVVGAGAAGLFCALALARAGAEPLLLERGDDTARRTEAVRSFAQSGTLDPESNVQFGLGGAGTFSDGKLASGIKSPAQRLVLQAFVDAGAQPSILFDAHPHVGSDVLPAVVSHLVREIESLGGEVRVRTRLVGINVHGGQVVGVRVAHADGSEENVSSTCVALATGHSARDVYELLDQLGVPLERKAFAMGVRIEHLQAEVDRASYGKHAGSPLLGAAPYKLVEHLGSGRTCYSFCMCPGGYVMAAASEPGGVVTNGMSLSGRDAANANAGLLVNVTPDDVPGKGVLAGIELQRRCERAAFERGGGDYVAPAQLAGDFVQGVASSGPGGVLPTYPRGVRFGTLEGCLPTFALDALREALPRFGRKLAAFRAEDAVLTGVETRSSSPVRVPRGKDGQSVGVRGLFPVGEGAGYAGGIMSAAVDGLRAAEAVVAELKR